MKRPPLGSRQLRGAIVGTGEISAFHLRAWRGMPGVEIVALADVVPDRAEALARASGLASARIYGDLGSLLAAERVDFIDVATPPHVHAENVVAAAGRGVHVLCQKPLAPSLEDARRMIAACCAEGVRCVVNENYRWRVWYRRVKRLLDAGTIGRPKTARFDWVDDQTLAGADGSPPHLLVRQPYAATQDRLILFEWGIHLVDVLRFFFGDVLRVTARTERKSSWVRGEDACLAVFEFVGVAATLNISWGTPVPPERRFARGMVEPLDVRGALGSIELDPFADDVLHLSVGGTRTSHDARGGLTRAEAYQECFQACQAHFVKSLRTGRPAENEAVDNWNTLAAVFAAYESADSGRRVEVAPRPNPT